MAGNKRPVKKARGMVSPLKFALNLETKSVDMYLRLAAKTANPLGKKLFYSLAGEEVEHAMKVDEIYNGIMEKGDLRLVANYRLLPSIESVMKGFFLKSSTRNLDKGNENVDGYKIALKLEKQSCEAYKRFADNSMSESEKRFFNGLLEQEKVHLDAVVNVYSYLTHNGDWLQEEESRTWNWMNI